MLEILHSFGSGAAFVGGMIVGFFLFRKVNPNSPLEKELRQHRKVCEYRLGCSAKANIRMADALGRIADKMEGGGQ